MKKIISISFFGIFVSSLFVFWAYSYFSNKEINVLDKYNTKENIELLNSKYKSWTQFLSEMKTEEEIVNWLQISKINKELEKEIWNLEKLPEKEYKEKLAEYIQKYPKEEFFKWKEKQLALWLEMLETKESLEEIKKVQENFKNLSLDDKYFVSDYIRHKNLSKMPYDKKLLLLNWVVDEVSKDYKKEWIFVWDISEEEFSEALTAKVIEAWYKWWDFESLNINFFCSHQSYSWNISQYWLNSLISNTPVSYKDVKTSLVEIPCDLEFKFEHTYTSNTRISWKTTALVNLIWEYWNKLSSRSDWNYTMVVVWAKRLFYWLWANDIKNNLDIFNI